MAKSTFTKFNGRSTFACTLCGRTTRDVDQGGTDLCPECYELCGLDNEINDDGRKPTGREQAHAAKLLASISKKGGAAKLEAQFALREMSRRANGNDFA